MKATSKGILISYLIGAPTGLMTIVVTFVMPAALTGEGLLAMALFGGLEKAILGLPISFLIALGIGGYYAVKNIEKQKSLIRTSFQYSLTINAIIWITFTITGIFTRYEFFSLADFIDIQLGKIMLVFIFSMLISPFTIGLLICYVIKRNINIKAD